MILNVYVMTINSKTDQLVHPVWVLCFYEQALQNQYCNIWIEIDVFDYLCCSHSLGKKNTKER